MAMLASCFFYAPPQLPSAPTSFASVPVRGAPRCQQSASISTVPHQAKGSLNRRQLLLGVSAACQILTFSGPALCLLEADDDEELLEKVKEDRKRKIRKRGEINAYKDAAVLIQKAIYQLSRAGQALDNRDFSSARNVLGESTDVDWIVDTKAALSKLSSNTEEQSQAELFSSAITSLQLAVRDKNLSSSKSAFVTSAGALEEWSYLTGFAEQLKGL